MAIPFSGGMPLYIGGASLGGASASADLFASGAENSGVFAAADLFVFAATGDNVASGTLPLSLTGLVEWLPASGGLPLSLTGTVHTAGGGVDLCLWNEQSGVSLGATLFVRGSGITAGAFPCDNSIPLTVARDPAGAITLFLLSEGSGISSGVPLYVAGSDPKTFSCDLSLPDVVGVKTGSVRLYTSGW